MLDVQIHRADCADWLKKAPAGAFHLSFLDPPFNQGKDYRRFDDKQDDAVYWEWMTGILAETRRAAAPGGWVYFMQREKNAEFVLRALRESGWNLQNLIVWKKMASAVPSARKFGLHYQVIASAVNGPAPRLFNRLRMRALPRPNHKRPPSKDGSVYVTDVWDDIRELTSGYYAGPEALRLASGARFHKQQAPLSLLGRIVLSSSKPGDVVFDPFSGTGTTLVAAAMTGRRGIGVEVDPINAKCIRRRVKAPRDADLSAMKKVRNLYALTEQFFTIWGGELISIIPPSEQKQPPAKAPVSRARDSGRDSDRELFAA